MAQGSFVGYMQAVREHVAASLDQTYEETTAEMARAVRRAELERLRQIAKRIGLLDPSDSDLEMARYGQRMLLDRIVGAGPQPVPRYPELTEIVASFDQARGSDDPTRPKHQAAFNWVRAEDYWVRVADPTPSEVTYRGETYREMPNATGNRRGRRAAASRKRKP